MVSLGGAGAGVLLVLTSAVCFGFMPIFARLAYAQGVGVDGLLFVRFLLAFLIMGVILVASRRLVLPRMWDLLVLVVLGAVVYFLQAILYFTSLLYSPVAVVALLLYTYPVLVTVSVSVLGWERISGKLAGAVAIAILGLLLIANPFGNPVGFGAILAFGSAVTYTVYMLSGSKILRRVRGDVAAFYVIGAASVSFGLTGEFTGTFHLNWGLMGWFWVATITVLCTVFGITAFFIGLSMIGPSRAALISIMEPATAVFASVLLFGNALSALQWFGGLLILAATTATALYRNPEPRFRTSK